MRSEADTFRVLGVWLIINGESPGGGGPAARFHLRWFFNDYRRKLSADAAVSLAVGSQHSKRLSYNDTALRRAIC